MDISLIPNNAINIMLAGEFLESFCGKKTCFNGTIFHNSDGKMNERLCPDGMVFNDYSSDQEKCDLPYNIDCSKRPKLREYHSSNVISVNLIFINLIIFLFLVLMLPLKGVSSESWTFYPIILIYSYMFNIKIMSQTSSNFD